MTLSNQIKGAKSMIRQTSKKLEEREVRTIQSSTLINEIAENTHLSSTDALSAFAMMINSIKTHLLQGDNVNLGDLGILSTCAEAKNDIEKQEYARENIKEVEVSFTASPHLKFELLEMARIHQHISICTQF